MRILDFDFILKWRGFDRKMNDENLIIDNLWNSSILSWQMSSDPHVAEARIGFCALRKIPMEQLVTSSVRVGFFGFLIRPLKKIHDWLVVSEYKNISPVTNAGDD